MKALFAALTAKPAGPSEHEQRIERELLEEKRRREDGEREAARREEDRRRDEQHRTELAAMNERVERTLREASASRSDPMMTVFKEVLISQQASAAATMQTMREASAATAAVAERNAITPQQVMEMVRTTRDGASESSKTVMETMRGLMKTQQEVMTSMIEIAGQGNQPWYAGAIQEGLNKVGMIGSAMAERNAQQQADLQRQRQRCRPSSRRRLALARRPPRRWSWPPPSAAPTPLRPTPAAAGGSRRRLPRPRRRQGSPAVRSTPAAAPRVRHTTESEGHLHPGGRPRGDGGSCARTRLGPCVAISPHDEGAPKFPAGAVPVAAAHVPTHVNGTGKKPRGRRAAAPVVEVVEVLPPGGSAASGQNRPRTGRATQSPSCASWSPIRSGSWSTRWRTLCSSGHSCQRSPTCARASRRGCPERKPRSRFSARGSTCSRSVGPSASLRAADGRAL